MVYIPAREAVHFSQSGEDALRQRQHHTRYERQHTIINVYFQWDIGAVLGGTLVGVDL